MVPTQTAPRNQLRADLARAAERAMAEGLAGTRNADGSWTVKTYTLRPVGARPQDVTCDCKAGQNGVVCKHLAVAVFGRKYNLLRVECRIA